MRRPPVIVSTGADIATVLRGDREALGLSGEEFDAIIGWPDRYTAKVENPHSRWGRTLFRFEPFGDFWLRGLNRALVLMDREQAESLASEHVSSPADGPRLERVRFARMSLG